MGDLGKQTRPLVDSLLASSEETQIEHYLTIDELLSSPAMLENLIVHLTDVRYRAMLLQVPDGRRLTLPWNLALWASPSANCIAVSDGVRITWFTVTGGIVQRVRDALDALEKTPLYRYDTLENGSDYIRFTQAAYQMEYNRKAVIVKPTPGMQMLPADVVESAFRDFLSNNFDAVVSSRDTLIYTFEKRVQNFYQRKQPTILLLSAEAMSQFARTGMMSDQFFAFRPYSKTERIRMLNALHAFAENKAVTLRFLSFPRHAFSFEAYENQGVLIYPSDTCYNTRMDQYRELFLPGNDFFALFDAYASEYLQEEPQTDAAAIFERLIREAEQSETTN